jgi:preprotein translocase subunit SecF
MLFGIVIGASSSVFIAAPILLILGEGRLRRGKPKTPNRETAPGLEAAG